MNAEILLVPFVSAVVIAFVGFAEASIETVTNIYGLEALFIDQQYQFLPIGPPSEDVLVQPYGPVLPVDWQQFPEAFTTQMYATMDGNGFPLYNILVYEDPITRETVFLNLYGTEAYRLAPEDGYDPYAWQAAWFGLESGQALDEWSSWIYDPAHVASRFTLIPEVFHEAYLEAQEETATQQLAMAYESMMLSLPEDVTNLVVGIGCTTSGTVEVEIG